MGPQALIFFAFSHLITSWCFQIRPVNEIGYFAGLCGNHNIGHQFAKNHCVVNSAVSRQAYTEL